MNIYSQIDTITPNSMTELKSCIVSMGYDLSTAEMILPNGNMLDPAVFTTSQYDNIDVREIMSGKLLLKAKKKTVYYVLVDAGYEIHGELSYPDENPGVLVCLNNISTDEQYNAIVDSLRNYIGNNVQLKCQYPLSNHAIYMVDNIEVMAINEIIETTKSMEYCCIWGNDVKITNHEISPGNTLIHLQLTEVEGG